MHAAEVSKCLEFKKNMVLVIDEMHIREDLVYDKNSGALIGFANLGEINTHLIRFRAALEAGKCGEEQLAKTVMVFMVQGLFSSLEFPYVQIPLTTATGDLLFDPLWEAVGTTSVRLTSLFLHSTPTLPYKIVHSMILISERRTDVVPPLPLLYYLD